MEENSPLGKAINYLLKHWVALTLFLRKAGAPLDNNLCERGLKRPTLHRKNSLSYRTLDGARVGDLSMSLIHTAELSGAQRRESLRLPRRAPQALQAGGPGPGLLAAVE